MLISLTVPKDGSVRFEMLFKKGVNFNDYPSFFKRGTFVRRINVQRYLTDEELEKIPVDKRPTEPVVRSVVAEVDVPSFSRVTNRVEFVFDGEEPKTGE
jgi:tRNA(His) 5'-end guanylyltransferase